MNPFDMTRFRRWSLLLALALPLAFTTSCDNDDEPDPRNEEETIPEVRIDFYTGATATGTPVLTIRGVAGTDGVISSNEITYTGSAATTGLTRGQSYAYSVTFGDAELLEEIGDEEADEHRFFLLFRQADEAAVTNYSVGVPAFTANSVSYTRTLPASDADDNGCAIGLTGTFSIPAGAAVSTGNGFPFLAVLRHQPPAGTSRVKTCSAPNANGNPNLGSSDVEVLFALRIN